MKSDLCKHGYPEPCTLCAHEDAEHDAAMASLYGGKTLEDMAREAGFSDTTGPLRDGSGRWRYYIRGEPDALERFAALVRAQALDEAAAVCTSYAASTDYSYEARVCAEYARDDILALKDRP